MWNAFVIEEQLIDTETEYWQELWNDKAPNSTLPTYIWNNKK